MSALELSPSADVERLVSVALRADERVAALVGDRVWTTWPANASTETKQAAVLLTRIGGGPPFSRPLALDSADLQVDAYDGRKHSCFALIATVLAALVDLTDLETPDGVVHGVTVSALRYVPDESFQPARPRYVADVTVTASPPRPVVAASRSRPVASSRGE